ncbi:MAG: choice-of-anchor B family protein [Bacteroidetes bacterium]|nr:choice-of-anchor B family protein [Bacteroidota bacterium]MDE2671626.1 choice-of-anchor B family protein [Bacteroidota bacterium]
MKRTLTLIAVLLGASTTLHAQYAVQYGAAVAVNDGQIIVGEGRQLLLPGNVFVYNMEDDGTWSQAQVITPGGERAIGFGQSLAADHSTLVIGAPLADEVYIYSREDNGTWSSSETITLSHARFGSSLALKGDHLIIGAAGGQDVTGGAYLYIKNDDNGWRLAEELTPEDVSETDGYGRSVAIHGNEFIVGAPRWNEGEGRAFVYSYNDAGEQQIEEIGMDNGTGGALFAWSVASAGEFLALSAPRHGGGTVALFSRNDGGMWEQMHTLASPDTTDDQRFGEALAASDNKLWISATLFNERNGGVYHVDLSDPQVSEIITPDGPQFRSGFGASLSADNNIVAVGASGQDNFEGAVYPLHVADDGVSIGEKLFNAASEIASITGEMTECESGAAGMFPCAEVDMVSFLTREEIGARRGIQVNDVWGWEDPQTGREYALVGRTDGTSFIDLTDPYNPVYLGDLPKTSTANQSLWRDIKVYKDHAFIVADGAGAHHMQVFDLTQLRDVTEPQLFTETAIYKGVYSSHNIVINEDTGYAYAVGNDSGGETCGGALHMINIQDPVNPTFAGCFADTRTGRRGTGSTHDAQCVTYDGPDRDFQGREICLSSNGNALSIADVTDKDNPVALSIAQYPNVAYTHQGWLTEDHRYFYLNDEGDETSELVEATRTLIFDISDLEDPILAGEYFGPSSAIDHNLYIHGDIMYQTNYVEGLRLVDISDPENPIEVGHFDTVPYGPNDNSPVLGAWSNYPYFKSGTIVVTSGREGVFFLKRRPIDT